MSPDTAANWNLASDKSELDSTVVVDVFRVRTEKAVAVADALLN